jgi:ribosomal protein L25 (general stress protein Ctc)
MEPLAIQADAQEVRKVVSTAGKHTPVNLTGSKRRIAMIKDVDFDPTMPTPSRDEMRTA